MIEYCFGKRPYQAVCSINVLADGNLHEVSLGANSQESFYVMKVQPERTWGPIRCINARYREDVSPDCENIAVKNAGHNGYVFEVAAVKSLTTGAVLSPTSDTVSAAAAVCCSIIWTSTGKVTFPEKDWKDDEAEVTMLCGPGKDASILIPMLPGLTCADFFARDVESKDCEIVGGPIRPTFEMKRHDNSCDWRGDDAS
ncbi:uncharacterized protein L969DRAFT_46121 [Mixia osmundae IAM 14324]|uniref:Uncharacterized protein n=1 Tax=Mixia osmundae (strain CBS 9802 / IAM 14324 / JCM 22182 / KY 12970) TaxID=764103 RepID=G7E5S7_MIXOS|nr:uncharacterized protein L969DRAFT_46121 [Mixia osmundae IAM 14324]KEI40662.1 hypothetical protein L969DRAFT_46121 [Mixia osmundae IAM 14324]GAA98187.1 hypothetical protein E5Q_04870 [Mixia osmundae IAM 14324]